MMLPLVVNAQVPVGSAEGYKNLHVYVQLTSEKEVQARAWLEAYDGMQDVCEIMYHHEIPVMHFKPVPAADTRVSEYHGVYELNDAAAINDTGPNYTTTIAFDSINPWSVDARWGLANILDNNFAQEERVAYHADKATSMTYTKYDFSMRYEGVCSLVLNPEKYPVHTTDDITVVWAKLFEGENKVALRDVDDDQVPVAGFAEGGVDPLS